MSEKKPSNTWICRNEKVLLKSPFVRLVQRECTSSEDEDRRYTFYVFESQDWCNIIPITEDGKVVLVRQYRIGAQTQTLEIPGGVVDSTDSEIAAAALRELTEETGYEPLPGARCVALGRAFANPAMQNNRCHSFIVGPVRRSQAQKLDAGEMIEVLEVPIEEIPERVARGEIDHALILNAFFFLTLGSDTGKELLRRGLREFT